MSTVLPEYIKNALTLAHPTWQDDLERGLHAMLSETPYYFLEIAKDQFFPVGNQLFAAFVQPKKSVRYVLLGEGPYPRAESATGVCFIDGAVKSLWQPEAGLSKSVNRATSLRNFIKMLLVAEGVLKAGQSTSDFIKPIADYACAVDSGWIKTAVELQDNLLKKGFLLLNASLIFRKNVPPLVDAKAWIPFLRCILQALSQQNDIDNNPVKLVLWGKIAERIVSLPEAAGFAKLIAEHPYNLSFINNQDMQNFFGPLHLLRQGKSGCAVMRNPLIVNN